MSPKRFWTEMTWEDFRDGDPGGWIAVLPVAAVEQHGPHLPVGVDSFIAEGYLSRARALFAVVAAGDVSSDAGHRQVGRAYRLSGHADAFRRDARSAPGPRSAKACTARGVEKLVIVNSHGGNSPIIDIVARNLRVRFGMLVVITSWHRLGYPKGLFSEEELLHGIHAGEIETSLMLALKTETVRAEMANAKPATIEMEREFTQLRAGHPAGFGWMAQDLHPSGAVGNAAAGTLDKGEAALDLGARAFVALIEDVHRFDLARLKEGPLGGGFLTQYAVRTGIRATGRRFGYVVSLREYDIMYLAR